MPKKYDWDGLKAQYMSGSYTSVAAFLREKNMPDPQKNSYVANKTRSWEKERQEMKQKAFDKFVDEASNELMKDTKAVRMKQAEIAAEVIKKSMDYLRSKAATMDSVDEARKLLQLGLDVQSKALGISDKPGKDQSLTQVNIYDSKFATILEEGDVEDIAGLLEGVKQARRRSLKSTGKPVEEEIRREDSE